MLNNEHRNSVRRLALLSSTHGDVSVVPWQPVLQLPRQHLREAGGDKEGGVANQGEGVAHLENWGRGVAHLEHKVRVD